MYLEPGPRDIMFHIVYITDEGYVLPTKASISSLVRSVQGTPVTVHVVAVGVSPKSQREIAALQGGSVTIEVLCAENDSRGLHVQHAYVSPAALLKFNLAELFPELDTLLFLDGDTLVLPGFLDIFGTDIGTAYVAAVMDLFSMRMCEWHKKLGLEHYFNSGVMLLNLKKWRQDGISEKLWANFSRPDYDSLYMEQNALNSVFGPNVVYLSVKYNFFDPKFTTELTPEDVIAFYGVPEDDFRHPVIRHLAGRNKPWMSATSATSNDWIDYVRPEDFLKVARNYCVTLADACKKNTLAQQTELAKANALRARDSAQLQTALNAVQFVLPGNDTVPYRLGENLISGKTDGVSLEGFHPEEAWGRWTEASCRIRVSAASLLNLHGDLHLRMRLHSFYTIRKMQLRVCGEILCERPIHVKDIDVDLKIAPSLVKREMTIEIAADGPILSLSDIGKGTDERKLAFAIRHMVLVEDLSSYLSAQQQDNARRDALQSALDARLAQLEDELRALQNAVHVIHLSVEALSSSRSYKIGRAITFLPRKIWRLVHR